MKTLDVVIVKTSIQVYKIRIKNDLSWADISVDEQGEAGRIQIASDFGDWQYYWGACGKPFKKFLLQLDQQYVARKFNADRWFDLEKTIQSYRHEINSMRKQNQISKTDKALLMEELDGLKDCTEKYEFGRLFYESKSLMQLVDGYPDLVYEVTPGFKMFWKNIWPVFIDELSKELNIAA